jgi:hypothetical protein
LQAHFGLERERNPRAYRLVEAEDVRVPSRGLHESITTVTEKLLARPHTTEIV